MNGLAELLNNNNNQLLVMGPEGFHKLGITFTNLGRQQEVLAKAAERQRVELPSVASYNGEPVNVTKYGRNTYMLFAVKELTFQTQWRIITEGTESFMVPFFSNTKDPDCAIARLIWPIPDGIKFRVGLNCCLDEYGIWRVLDVFFIVTLVGEKGFYLPPIPNVHAHGLVCLGSRNGQSSERLLELPSLVERNISQTQWNGDLVTSLGGEAGFGGRDVRLLKFLARNMEYVPYEGDLKEVMFRTNNTTFERFML